MSYGIERRDIKVSCSPRHMARSVAISTASVVSFMPAAAEPGAPPMNISAS